VGRQNEASLNTYKPTMTKTTKKTSPRASSSD
jgi:hypothetical protein